MIRIQTHAAMFTSFVPFGELPGRDRTQDRFLAVARPPLRPAAFFCAVVPPWLELPPEPDFFPPRLEAPGELAMRAARCFDIPFSLSASYCLSFFTLARFSGISSSFRWLRHYPRELVENETRSASART
jgi:hypothetical protein